MPAIFQTYISCYVVACLVAVWLSILYRNRIELFHSGYWKMLFQGWKFVTFVIALAALNVMAPYTGDPTWDYVDATFMSVFTYLSAPWSVGIIYRAIRGKATWVHVYVAICVWMFSASWSYDLYLVWRDGMYPLTWFANIFASSVLYASAGLLWSLEWREGRGVIFCFLEDDWLDGNSGGQIGRLLWYALPFIALAMAMLLPFIL